MSIRTLLIGLLALLFGGAAALLARNFIDVPLPAAQGAVVETVKVVVAKAEVQRGALLTKEQLELKDFPKDFVPVGTLLKLEDALDRVPNGLLVMGEVVLDNKLAPKGAGAGLGPLIKPGMRATNIALPSFSATVAGFIQPGHFVDVMATLNLGERGNFTTTILQMVEVLAVHQRLDPAAGSRSTEAEASTVTLQLTPDEAALLELAQSKGTLKLVLRSPKDRELFVSRIVDEKRLRPGDVDPERVEQLVTPPKPEVEPTPGEVAKPKPEVLPDWVVILQQGGKVEEIPFLKNKKLEPKAP